MKIVRIEYLCEVFKSSYSYGDQLFPIGQYKLFFEDGSSIVQDYVLTKDRKEAKTVKYVTEFSEEL